MAETLLEELMLASIQKRDSLRRIGASPNIETLTALMLESAVCERYPRLWPLLSEVRDRLCIESAKRLTFSFLEVNVIYQGCTDDSDSSVNISLNPSLNQDSFEKVLAHELGEADYIARHRPDINRRGEELPNRFVEIFSHHHAAKLLESHGLQDLSYAKNPPLVASESEFWQGLGDRWQFAIKLAWLLTSFPTRRADKVNLPHFGECAQLVDELVKVSEAISIEDKPDEVVRAIDQGLEMLKANGLNQDWECSPREPVRSAGNSG